MLLHLFLSSVDPLMRPLASQQGRALQSALHDLLLTCNICGKVPRLLLLWAKLMLGGVLIQLVCLGTKTGAAAHVQF
jgi:hypothetical protein